MPAAWKMHEERGWTERPQLEVMLICASMLTCIGFDKRSWWFMAAVFSETACLTDQWFLAQEPLERTWHPEEPRRAIFQSFASQLFLLEYSAPGSHPRNLKRSLQQPKQICHSPSHGLKTIPALQSNILTMAITFQPPTLHKNI